MYGNAVVFEQKVQSMTGSGSSLTGPFNFFQKAVDLLGSNLAIIDERSTFWVCL